MIWTIRSFAAAFSPRERIRVYYDDNDHSKGYYYVSKHGDTYPVGYPMEKMVEDMAAFERLKREQKAKNGGRSSCRTEYAQRKHRLMWLQILLMTPAEYKEYRRHKKEQKL